MFLKKIILSLAILIYQNKLLASRHTENTYLEMLKSGITENDFKKVQDALEGSLEPHALAVSSVSIIRSVPDPAKNIIPSILGFLRPRIDAVRPLYKDLEKRRPTLHHPQSQPVGIIEWKIGDDIIFLDAIVGNDGHTLDKYGYRIKS